MVEVILERRNNISGNSLEKKKEVKVSYPINLKLKV